MRPRVLIALAALLGAGCADSEPSFPPLPAGSRAGELASSPGMYRVTHWTLRGSARERVTRSYAADLGTLAVPENRRAAHSRVITLPIIRVRATGERAAEPLFWLGGGPGQSDLHTMRNDLSLEQHDRVMVGYRGVDGSVSLDCPEVTEAMRSLADVLATDAPRRVGDAYERCAARLRAAGVDLDGYTPLEVAADLEDARRALGYPRIDVLAESYGTRVAYLYGVTHPDRVRRMALLGANPPGHMVWEPDRVEAQLRQYGALWASDPAARQRAPDLVAAIGRVSHDMPRRWLGLPIHAGNAKAASFAFLFDTTTAVRVLDTWVAAEQGDPSGLWLLSFVSQFVFPESVNWGDNASKAASADFDPARDYATEMMPPKAALGSPLAAFLWASAGRWPIAPMPAAYRRLKRCDVETLIVSGSLDFTTPAESAAELLAHLPRGRQVVLAEMGHTGDMWSLQPAGVARLLRSFFDTGRADASLLRYQPVDFRVDWGYPRIAKLVLAAAVVSVVLGVAALVWLARRIGRRSGGSG